MNIEGGMNMSYNQNDIQRIADYYDNFLASEPGKYSSFDEFWARYVPVLSYLKKYSLAINILDVGCGTGIAAEKLKIFGTVYGLDISPKSIDQARKYNRCDKCYVGIAEELPFDNDLFDVVICTEVIEHLLDPAKALSEFNRVLKYDGSLIISTPNPYYWALILGKIRSKLIQNKPTNTGQIIENYLAKSYLENLFSSNGFKIIHFHTAYFKPKFLGDFLFRLCPDVGLYQICICKKISSCL